MLTCTEGDGQTDVEFKNGTWTLLWVRVARPTHDGATATRINSFSCGPAKYPIHLQPSNSHPILGVKKTRLDRIQPESSQYKKGTRALNFKTQTFSGTGSGTAPKTQNSDLAWFLN